MPATNEVHLRRLTVDEALPKLDQYLNDAFMAGLCQGEDTFRLLLIRIVRMFLNLYCLK